MLGLSGARQSCHPLQGTSPALHRGSGAPARTSPAVVAVIPSGNAVGGAQVQARAPAPHWGPGCCLPTTEIVVKGAVGEVLCGEKGQQ